MRIEEVRMAGKAKPIPDGYRTITPHLIVKDGAKAIDFYKKAFGAEERGRMAGPDGRLMHAELKIGDSIVMLADEYPEMGGKSPATLSGTPVTLHLYVTDADAAFKKAVAAGAKATMPIADMFWGDRYGRVTDPFGHEWSIATHMKDMTADEMAKAAKAAMSK
jgi:uncharacterized glyoxalase superfamily protein PhnB